MKKLMIAVATAAMVGGVYATTGCDGCNNEEGTYQCPVSVYNVKFSLKTLANKSAKNGECVGYYYEQGSRTIEGLLWSCCADCDNWFANGSGAADTEWQYALWEKKNSRVFTMGVEWQRYAKGADTFTAEQTFKLKQVGGSFVDSTDAQTIVSDAKASQALALADLNGKKPVYPGADYVWEAVTVVKYTTIAGTQSDKGHYVDTQANVQAYRFAKNAKSVMMGWDVDTAGDTIDSVAGLNTFEGDTGAVNDVFNVWAVGIGSLGTDGDDYVIKSLSGNCAGNITAYFCEDDVCGQVLTLCDDFTNWCDPACFQMPQVHCYGTWTLKYVNKLSKGFSGAIPSFARAF